MAYAFLQRIIQWFYWVELSLQWLRRPPSIRNICPKRGTVPLSRHASRQYDTPSSACRNIIFTFRHRTIRLQAVSWPVTAILSTGFKKHPLTSQPPKRQPPAARILVVFAPLSCSMPLSLTPLSPSAHGPLLDPSFERVLNPLNASPIRQGKSSQTSSWIIFEVVRNVIGLPSLNPSMTNAT